MEKPTNPKAFPDPTLCDTQHARINDLNDTDHYGMDLRDYFAAKAMQGIIVSDKIGHVVESFAIEAYKIADAMLKEREK